MIRFTLNDQTLEVPEGTTVLRAAEKAKVIIPTLCDHPNLTPYGGCRLCLVEVQGARVPQTACTLEITQNMVVKTESPALIRARKVVLEMLLSNFYDAGYETSNLDTQFMHWVKHYGVDPTSVMMKQPRYPINQDLNPFLWVDFNKCILCMRCVRACAQIQGRFVWGAAGRGIQTHIIAGADTDLISARCESCGACVAYCPTGALDNKMSLNMGTPDRLVTTTCTYCGVGCQFDLNVKDGKVIRVTSNPNAPVNGMALCVKGRYGYDFIHHPDRLTRPLVRDYLLNGGQRSATGDRGKWIEVDWDTALNITAARLTTARNEYGPDSVGVLTSAKCLNEENYLMNKLARQVIGTNNIDHCARL